MFYSEWIYFENMGDSNMETRKQLIIDITPAEEINVPLKKIGMIMILSIVLAVAFYALIILGVGYVMSPSDISSSQAGSGLVTADAMAKAVDMYQSLLFLEWNKCGKDLVEDNGDKN
jgi:hypothetical protein